MPRSKDPDPLPQILRRQLLLTRIGLLSEQVLRAFWPVISLVLAVVALLMLGVHDMLPVEAVWVTGAVAAIALVAGMILGLRLFRFPRRDDALARLDETIPGRPIAALLDKQAIGADDAGARQVWQVYRTRMTLRARTARAPKPDLNLAARDPFALRYAALLAFLVAVLFGSVWRVGTVTDLGPGGAVVASGPSWEGWIEPPRYTGLPTLYLNDQTGGRLDLAENSRVTLRFYGEVGALTLAETVSGDAAMQEGDTPSSEHEIMAKQPGDLRIVGSGGRAWQVGIIRDTAPQIAVAGPMTPEAGGQMALPFTASDDYGVIAGQAVITLDLDALDRRFGLALDPEPVPPITVDLPMPIAGDRHRFTETLIEDFSKHVWANLPVTVSLSVTDEAGQTGIADPFGGQLPARRFFDPLAAAVAEQRRDLLWAVGNGARITQVLRAVSHRPDDLFRSETAYLRLRFILRRMDRLIAHDLLAAHRDEIAEALWDLAVLLEEGDLGDAMERLRRAQERLAEAMRNGASDQEIADLMQELRDATNEYMRQLSRQAQQEGQEGQNQQMAQDMMRMSQDDLQRMMDRIQELMEQGRMAEAEQALQELQQMMENMRVTQGQQGQGGQSEGQQAMEGLAETLRDQQGLSDQAFRDLQEQFNPGAQAGESQGNQGQSGGQGRGQSHEGQGGSGSGDDGEQGGGGEGSLADRQQALRDELGRQRNALPGAGTPEGDAARDALGRAGEAMDGAEQSLRQNDYAEAIDQQSEAMEALREGMRALGEAMAQQQEQQGAGSPQGDMQADNRDPLGRRAGSTGGIGTEENLLQGDDVYRRARELLDEIRERTGDGERPRLELDYLRRLLDRF